MLSVASQVVCGTCGTVLPNLTATCPECGAHPAGVRYRKSPLLAAALSLVPGCGHFYLGQPVKGLFFLFGCGGLEALGLDLDLTLIGAAVGVPSGAGGLALYAYQIWDAYHEARKTALT